MANRRTSAPATGVPSAWMTRPLTTAPWSPMVDSIGPVHGASACCLKSSTPVTVIVRGHVGPERLAHGDERDAAAGLQGHADGPVGLGRERRDQVRGQAVLDAGGGHFLAEQHRHDAAHREAGRVGVARHDVGLRPAARR